MPRFQGVPVSNETKPGGRFGGVPVEPAKPRGIADEAKYIAGRTGRLAIQGTLSLPALVADFANALTDLGITGINKVTGSNIPALGPVSGTITRALDKFTPPSNTIVEKLSDVGANALGGAGLARFGASALTDLPRIGAIAKSLADSPLLQATGGMAGMAATEGARNAGVENPLALGAIGLMGSVLPGGGATAVTRGASGLRQAVKPFASRGREEIVGEALNRQAVNPRLAQQRMSEAQEIVPGSLPMVSQVSRDPGLIRSESALEGLEGAGRLAQRRSEQNTARQTEFERIARDEDTLAYATAKRDRAYDELAVPAFKNSQPIEIGRDWINNPVRRKIQEIRESKAGARQTVRSAMDEAESYLTAEGVDLTDAATLYEIRKDLALIRDGKLVGRGKSGAELANVSTARSQLADVIKSLDETIEGGAPGYQDYLRVFAKRSVPLDQLKALQNIRSRAALAAPDPVSGQPILSQAKFTTLLRNNMTSGLGLRGSKPGDAKLSGQQLRTLDRIAADLDRGAAVSSGTMKVAGSDTFKNLSIASVIGRILGDESGGKAMQTAAMQTITRGNVNPLAWLYHVPDREIQQLMLEAWLDPRLAAQLMRRADRAEIQNISNILKERAAKQASAAALYAGAE